MTSSAVSYLFVPASRPDRYGKALGSDADAVIIDLEDAVPVDEKDDALTHLLAALEEGLPRPAYLRINAEDSAWFERDVEALAGLSDGARSRVAGILVPKAETAESLEKVREALRSGGGAGVDAELIPTIESAAGVLRIRDMAAVAGVTRFAVGAADLSVDLDVEIASSTVDHVYAQLVVESRAAGLAGPVASPPFTIKDTDAVERDAKRLRGLGATAQLSIHPAQLPAIHTGFLPGDDQVEWARKIISATDGVSQVDGQMVDKPILERAERILAQAKR